jgi:hypothetical protein
MEERTPPRSDGESDADCRSNQETPIARRALFSPRTEGDVLALATLLEALSSAAAAATKTAAAAAAAAQEAAAAANQLATALQDAVRILAGDSSRTESQSQAAAVNPLPTNNAGPAAAVRPEPSGVAR